MRRCLARGDAGRPVRLQWMRDDEFAWEPYGPAMVMQAKASLDADGKIVDWQYELWSNTHSTRPTSTTRHQCAGGLVSRRAAEDGPHTSPPQPAGGGDRNAIPLYDFPSQRVVHHFLAGDADPRLGAAYARCLRQRVRVGILHGRTGGGGDADPVAFRLAHMKDPRARAVIEKVAAMADWKPGEKGDGTRGRGIAFSKYKNLACYVACVADVEVDRASGKVRVPRAWAATDAGLVINPDGLNSPDRGRHRPVGELDAATRRCSFDKNGILSRDWANYPIMTMPDAPKVEAELINRPTERSLGAGEGSQGPAVAAIANAFANATGKRLRDLPFTPDRVKKALA